MNELLSRFSPREKAILATAVIALSGILIHALLIEPFNQKKLELNEALEQANIDLKWMRTAVYQLPRGNVLAQAIEFEGSLANLIDKEVRSATVQAKTDCELLQLSNDNLHLFAKNHANGFTWLVVNIARVLSSRLRVANQRLTDRI